MGYWYSPTIYTQTDITAKPYCEEVVEQSHWGLFSCISFYDNVPEPI